MLFHTRLIKKSRQNTKTSRPRGSKNHEHGHRQAVPGVCFTSYSSSHRDLLAVWISLWCISVQLPLLVFGSPTVIVYETDHLNLGGSWSTLSVDSRTNYGLGALSFPECLPWWKVWMGISMGAILRTRNPQLPRTCPRLHRRNGLYRHTSMVTNSLLT